MLVPGGLAESDACERFSASHEPWRLLGRRRSARRLGAGERFVREHGEEEHRISIRRGFAERVDFRVGSQVVHPPGSNAVSRARHVRAV